MGKTSEKENKKAHKKESKRKRRRSNSHEDDDKAKTTTPKVKVEENGDNIKQTMTKSVPKTPTSDQNNKKAKKADTPSSSPIAQKKDNGKSQQEAMEHSAFFNKKIQLVVSLLPSALSDVVQSVTKLISNSMLLRFNDSMDGILLAFDSVKICKTKKKTVGGYIMNEMPHIHYNVEMNALIFSPKIGMRLSGVVNELFPSHVSVLIHSFFNATVSADHLRKAGYTFDADTFEWITERSRGSINGNSSNELSLEDEVSFTVDTLHECAGIMSMEGSKLQIVC
uniref:RPA43 OB domain-containing protein n=1 Tax=Ditylum brightwellii TaxID=49249 RepID=A0A6V2ITE1_9STRA|mmetsp:Transcript_16084/g.21335  ORF Transcript_16084/g.21335 Transcript_16084/m.21335 type:complete len:281 (+) Transcript_16084:117-959(+)